MGDVRKCPKTPRITWTYYSWQILSRTWKRSQVHPNQGRFSSCCLASQEFSQTSQKALRVDGFVVLTLSALLLRKGVINIPLIKLIYVPCMVFFIHLLSPI